MSVRFYSDDEDEGKEEEGEYEKPIRGRDSVIFAIDCCKEMFEGDESETPFNRVLNAIHDMMRNKIITSDKDLHGIIFFGTDKYDNPSDFSNIYVWQPFDVPSVKSITELREMQNADDKMFVEKFGFKQDHQMSNVLWACLNMFSGTSFKLATKTLIVFTWNDNPHFGDDNARKRAKAKASDLHDHDVDVQVLSFNKNFKYDNFYKEIISDPENTEPFPENPVDSIENLYGFLLRKCSKQRPLARLPLRLGDEVEMSVGVYTVAKRTTKTAAVNIDIKTNQEVRHRTNLVDTNTGEILMPSDIKLMQTYAGRDIVFEKEEVQEMRRFGKQGLSVLGFKPRSKAIKTWYHVRNAQFIYPDEKTIKGSTTLFTALLTKCLEKDVVAICNYVARGTSPPRCVALLPQAENIDPETNTQISPPGFYIIFLPFADDIRHIEIERGRPNPSEEQVAAAEALTKRLRFPYNPENFDNPVIQTHYKNLEAMALEKEQPEPIDNHTIPDFDTIEKKAGALIRNFKELAFPPGYDPNKKATKQKSSTAASAGGKKAKEQPVQIDVEDYIARNQLGKLTVQGLKEICRKYDIKSTGKKADIISSIENHFS